MAELENVMICIDCKVEVGVDSIDEHLDTNPTHRFVEAIRKKDAPQPVTTVMPVVAEQITQSVEDESPVPSHLRPQMILTWSESSISGNDWCQIGSASDTRVAHRLPFDCEIIGISISYKRVRNGDHALEIYVNGTDYTTDVVYTSPTIAETSSEGYYNDNNLSIVVPAGQSIRIRGGYVSSSGYFDKTVVNLIVRRAN